MTRKIDVFIVDVGLPTNAKLIPDWYSEIVGCWSWRKKTWGNGARC